MIRDMEGSIIVAYYSNAKAVEWSEPCDDSRGNHILEIAAKADHTMISVTAKTAIRRSGYRKAIPDITLATAG